MLWISSMLHLCLNCNLWMQSTVFMCKLNILAIIRGHWLDRKSDGDCSHSHHRKHNSCTSNTYSENQRWAEVPLAKKSSSIHSASCRIWSLHCCVDPNSRLLPHGDIRTEYNCCHIKCWLSELLSISRHAVVSFHLFDWSQRSSRHLERTHSMGFATTS